MNSNELDAKKFAELEILFQQDTYGNWDLRPCFADKNNTCWCTVIGLEKYPEEDSEIHDDYTYVVGAGCIPKYFGNLAVVARNNFPILMEKLVHAETVIRTLSEKKEVDYTYITKG